mgnify:FL=1
MTDSTSEKSKRDSVRIIMEGAILAGLLWLIGNSVQQSKDIAVIRVNSDFISQNANKVPDLILRVQKIEDRQTRTEERVGNLEALERAK